MWVFRSLDAVDTATADGGSITTYNQTSNKTADFGASAPLNDNQGNPLTVNVTGRIIVGVARPDGSNPFDGVSDPTTVADFVKPVDAVSPGGSVSTQVPVVGPLPVRNWAGIEFTKVPAQP